MAKVVTRYRLRREELFGKFVEIEDALKMGCLLQQVESDRFNPAWVHYCMRDLESKDPTWFMPVGSVLFEDGTYCCYVIFKVVGSERVLIDLTWDQLKPRTKPGKRRKP